MRRIYFLLPDVNTARTLVRELEEQGFFRSQLHLVTGSAGTGHLVARSIAEEESDAARIVTQGSLVGAGVGLLIALMLVWVPEQGLGPDVIALVTLTAVGAGLGAWLSTVIGGKHSGQIGARTDPETDDAWTLMMVDVSPGEVDDCRELVVRRYPQAQALRIRRLPSVPGQPGESGTK